MLSSRRDGIIIETPKGAKYHSSGILGYLKHIFIIRPALSLQPGGLSGLNVLDTFALPG